MLEDKSKLIKVGKYGGARLYIPSKIVSDSQFPLEIGGEVTVKIDPEKRVLIVSGAG